jgi:hypothetical protein
MASADGLFGIDLDILDIFGHDNKKKSDHPATRVNAQQNTSDQEDRERRVFGVGIRGGVAEGAGGGGGGVAAPRSGDTGRPSTLPPVPTEPSSRTIVIRAEPSLAAPGVPAAPPPVALPPVTTPPVVVPPVVMAPAPGGVPPPSAQPPLVSAQPRVVRQPQTADALGSHALPASFRIGYADSLRVATLGGLAAVALPGLGGILAFTAAGTVAGYRQAKAAQVLPPANIARFMQ